MPFGTSSSELMQIIASLGLKYGFLGVFDKNFPGFLDTARTAFAIVNTGDYVSGGVHWIAFAYDHCSAKFYLFDPFGWSKAELFKKYRFQYENIVRQTALRNLSRCVTLVRSTEAVQCVCSAACGLFCCLFLASFVHYRPNPMANNPIIDIVTGIPHKLLLTARGTAITHLNQENLYVWLYYNSEYFRENVMEIKANTKINAIKMH